LIRESHKKADPKIDDEPRLLQDHRTRVKTRSRLNWSDTATS
jgi:hypothetical protein